MAAAWGALLAWSEEVSSGEVSETEAVLRLVLVDLEAGFGDGVEASEVTGMDGANSKEGSVDATSAAFAFALFGVRLRLVFLVGTDSSEVPEIT